MFQNIDLGPDTLNFPFLFHNQSQNISNMNRTLVTRKSREISFYRQLITHQRDQNYSDALLNSYSSLASWTACVHFPMSAPQLYPLAWHLFLSRISKLYIQYFILNSTLLILNLNCNLLKDLFQPNHKDNSYVCLGFNIVQKVSVIKSLNIETCLTSTN